MLISLAAVIGGLAVLIWSADYFVEGAAATASRLGVSHFVIGLTIIGFGTSAPELLISGISAWQGAGDIAVGNAIGSNFANLTLILGATALIAPIVVPKSVVKREFPVLIGVSLLGCACLLDGELSRVDAVILALLFAASMYYLSTNGSDEMAAEDEEIPDEPINKALIKTVVGIVLLSLSSRVLVWGAVDIATELGVSELIIGLTILAIGTSLPELSASIASARRGMPEMALGNVVGSNLFNTLAVLSVAGFVQPATISDAAITRDIPLMLGITVLVFLAARQFGQFSRNTGYALLGAFALYLGALVYISL